MPIYEYKCEKCGKEFEELIFNDTDSVECPDCGSKETGRLMSCCRFKNGGGSSPDLGTASAPSSSGGGCAGCSGGDCSSCG